MKSRFFTFKDIKKRFPSLKPSRLDYLVREGLVECRCNGQGRPRLYPLQALDQIQAYLDRINTTRTGAEITPGGKDFE